ISTFSSHYYSISIFVFNSMGIPQDCDSIYCGECRTRVAFIENAPVEVWPAGIFVRLFNVDNQNIHQSEFETTLADSCCVQCGKLLGWKFIAVTQPDMDVMVGTFLMRLNMLSFDEENDDQDGDANDQDDSANNEQNTDEQDGGGDQDEGTNNEQNTHEQDGGGNQQVPIDQEVGTNEQNTDEKDEGTNNEQNTDEQDGCGDQQVPIDQELGTNEQNTDDQDGGGDQDEGTNNEQNTDDQDEGTNEQNVNQDRGSNQQVLIDQEVGTNEQNVNQQVPMNQQVLNEPEHFDAIEEDGGCCNCT
ncbi:hypothetical protein AABB24_011777, partial [Solanum stoloniferum]